MYQNEYSIYVQIEIFIKRFFWNLNLIDFVFIFEDLILNVRWIINEEFVFNDTEII